MHERILHLTPVADCAATCAHNHASSNHYDYTCSARIKNFLRALTAALNLPELSELSHFLSAATVPPPQPFNFALALVAPLHYGSAETKH